MKRIIIGIILVASIACSSNTTPDGDADSDGDSDADFGPDTDLEEDSGGDADSDADPDIDLDSPCERDCALEPLRNVCEIGDCTHSGLPRQCCVSTDPICHTTASIGELFGDLEVSYRGFYDNDLLCALQLVETREDSTLTYTLQTRGTTVMPFIQLSLDVSADEVEEDTSYELCDSDAPPSMGLEIDIYTSLEVEPSRYRNIDCDRAGSLVFNALGAETGDAYELVLEGTITGVDDEGEPNEETLEIEISSEGVLEVTR